MRIELFWLWKHSNQLINSNWWFPNGLTDWTENLTQILSIDTKLFSRPFSKIPILQVNTNALFNGRNRISLLIFLILSLRLSSQCVFEVFIGDVAFLRGVKPLEDDEKLILRDFPTELVDVCQIKKPFSFIINLSEGQLHQSWIAFVLFQPTR